jgi:hypothetical protein
MRLEENPSLQTRGGRQGIVVNDYNWKTNEKNKKTTEAEKNLKNGKSPFIADDRVIKSSDCGLKPSRDTISSIHP